MATRSTIAVGMPSGIVQSVYCHWDGYLDHNGQILLAHYSDWNTAADLISLGQISSLRKTIGVQHSFDTREPEHEDMTTYYGRDRGETDVGYNTYSSFADYQQRHQGEEYDYILRQDGHWYVRYYDTPLTLLADAIAAEMIDKALAEDE
jgi:hypothetical protein